MIYTTFKDVAGRLPANTAVVSGEQRLSYAGLSERVDELARCFLGLGIKEGDAVALIMPNGIDLIVAVFALMAIRVVAVPVNSKFQQDELKYYIETSNAVLVVCHPDLSDALQLAVPERRVMVFSGIAPKSSAAVAGGDFRVDGKDFPALHMYSSGSTGKPKRVTRTQGDIVCEFQALAATIALSAQDRILCTVPVYHAHGFCNCLMAALLSGGTLVLLPGEFNARETVRAIEGEKITIYPAVPFMFKMMAETFMKKAPDMSNVRLMFSAGASLPSDVHANFKRVYGHSVRQLYGSTETGAVAINYEEADGTEATVGKPLRGIFIDILDESASPVKCGETGEVAIRSPAMTTRYDGLPEITAECFKGGYFFPGDLGSKDEQGRITIRGRSKLLINVAGNKVDPLDVESIIRLHHSVTDVVVLGHEHPNYGEMVKAVVVVSGQCAAEEIVNLCANHLAEYKVPKLVEFRSEIPRSPLGKVLRKYL